MKLPGYGRFIYLKIFYMQIIKLANYSENLVTRQQAIDIYNDIDFTKLPIIFDFSWIKRITTNFADELFWKIIVNRWKVFKIKNIDDPFSKQIIINAINTRLHFTV